MGEKLRVRHDRGHHHGVRSYLGPAGVCGGDIGLAAEAMAYMTKYGATEKDAARVAVRDRKHAINNPYAQLRKEITIEDVMNSPMLSDPIKLLDVCPGRTARARWSSRQRKYAEKICDRPAWFHGASVKHPYNYWATAIGTADWCRWRWLERALREGRDQGAAQGNRRDGALPSLLVRGALLDRVTGLVRAGQAPKLLWTA